MVVGEISQERDLVIIGGGPGGYSAAIRAAQLGLSVTLIERDKLGGVCLNKGCIPSKVFTYAAKKKAEMSHLQQIGLPAVEGTFQLDQLIAYKSKVTEQLRKGVEALCKANKVEVIQGKAGFTAENKIGVEYGHQFDVYVFKQAIIASGSSPVLPGGITETGKRILLSHNIFSVEEMPTHLLVYGSSYISLEVASSFHALGAKVTVLWEGTADFSFDESVNKELARLFKKKKIKLIKQAAIQSAEETAAGVHVTLQAGGKEEVLEGSHLFVEGSRLPNTKELGIGRFAIEQTEKGFIRVNKDMQTSLPSVYAIGDVTEGPLLAVKAIKQGKAAAEAIAGERTEVDLTCIPTIVHTIPPIASVGLTEQEARERVGGVRTSKFNLGGNGYAAITGKRDGFVKVISDASTDLILGIHMIGEGAVELSSHFVQLLEMAAKEEDAKFPLYAHPSYNEGLLEAVEGLVGQAVHAVT
ncbi:dihydrolipoyl dehydrogenase [Bacillus thermotolerans]|uniref:Dihydrolipoyl dehydrogenase n=1 Tax=Bacillus thermotolerans TaxID=1221996 RepID=A0A0F5I794_BACTR|nr:dihydrolipoyl dehydrogenase [Bacillus thermotolerans]KKB41145.1 Dihydrolipoamide dehydrogenase of pyruvate dehydrogenase complex [Bacillus thermotolerans]